MASNNPQIYPNASQNGMSINPQQNCQMDNASLPVPLAIFYALFFLFGLAGNLLALWVFLEFTPRRTCIFLIKLALADLLFVICLPFRVAYHSENNQWVLPEVLCRIVGNVFYMNMYISIILLGLISVDRYLYYWNRTKLRISLRTI